MLRNVPVLVWGACGEVHLDAEGVKQLDVLFRRYSSIMLPLSRTRDDSGRARFTSVGVKSTQGGVNDEPER